MEQTAQQASRALYGMGWRSQGDNGQILISSLKHTSTQYPDKVALVWVANFAAAPTRAIFLGPKS